MKNCRFQSGSEMKISRRRCRRILSYPILVTMFLIVFLHHVYHGQSCDKRTKHQRDTDHPEQELSLSINTRTIKNVRKILKTKLDPIPVKRQRHGFYRYDVELDKSEEYGIVQHVFAADEDPVREDVTLSAMIGTMNFEDIVRIANEWNGPMEVTVFLTSVKLWEDTMLMFEALRNTNSNIRRYVSWHIVCVIWEDFDIGLQYYADSQIDERDEVKKHMHKLKQQALNYAGNGSTSDHVANYPGSLMINTAYEASRTEFFFHIDSDLTPCEGLREKFLNFAEKLNLFVAVANHSIGAAVGLGIRVSKVGQYRPNSFSIIPNKPGVPVCESIGTNQTPLRDVYVVPTFQTKQTDIPRTVTEIKRDFRLGESSSFYYQAFPPAYAPTNHKAWVDMSYDGAIDCAYEVKYSLYYEPFVIVRKGAPKYDERFNGFAFVLSNQHVSLAAAGYKFKVLKNAFLVHKGWKEKDYLTPQKRKEIKDCFPKWWKFVHETDKKYNLVKQVKNRTAI